MSPESFSREVFILTKKWRRFYFVASCRYPSAGCSSAEPASVSRDGAIIAPASGSVKLVFSFGGANAARAAFRLPWRSCPAASSLPSRAAKISSSRPASLSDGVT